MALKEFKDYPNTETPIDAENLNFNFNEVFNLIFPIGKVEVFFDNEDHSNYMGFTWERTAVGKVLVGYDPSDTDFDTIGKTGGEKTHTLTVDEMPKHKHILFTATGGTINFDAYTSKDNGSNGDTANTGWGTETNASGSSQPHNNVQPYEVVAYWKRIS